MAINGFSGSVAFTASGLPSGAIPTFTPQSITGPGTSTLTISTLSSTPAGTNLVTINAISNNGGLIHGTNIMLVVTANNSPPILMPISNQAINAGITLAITNVATDSDAPAQALTFNLLAAPAGAALNASSGVFTWRPAVAQANTTNLTTLKVTDSGAPPLSATQSFTIVVNPLARPVLGLSRLSNGWQLNVTGPIGPDYSIQGASNLMDWTSLAVSNSPALPFNWIDTNNASTRFYRLLLGAMSASKASIHFQITMISLLRMFHATSK